MDADVKEGIKGQSKGGVVLQQFPYAVLQAVIQGIGIVFRIGGPSFGVALKIQDTAQVTGIAAVEILGLVHMARIAFVRNSGVEAGTSGGTVVDVNGIVLRTVQRYGKVKGRT